MLAKIVLGWKHKLNKDSFRLFNIQDLYILVYAPTQLAIIYVISRL